MMKFTVHGWTDCVNSDYVKQRKYVLMPTKNCVGKRMKERRWNMETVDIIASGYEWICPKCGWFNREIEITETVECADCERVFETNPAEHAYGKWGKDGT